VAAGDTKASDAALPLLTPSRPDRFG